MTNETLYLVYTYFCVTLTDFVSDKSHHFYTAFIQIFIFVVFVLINLIFMIIQFIDDEIRKKKIKNANAVLKKRDQLNKAKAIMENLKLES